MIKENCNTSYLKTQANHDIMHRHFRLHNRDSTADATGAHDLEMQKPKEITDLTWISAKEE